jgi:hypothetical protein
MTTSRRFPRRFSILFALSALVSTAALLGCQGAEGGPDELDEEVGESSLALCQNPRKEAKRLFEKETFGGNGRTCLTCHSKETGTVSPEDAQERFAEDPSDPLFLHDGSDDFEGNGVSRMLADATVLVRIPLPPNVTLADDPTATSIVVRRGIPTTLNTPALDPVLMLDGRAPDLEALGLDAIHSHTENTVEPTQEQLELIADHQRTKKFFSSHELEDFADGGPAPTLPQGRTAAEKRGRKWFEDAPLPTTVNQSTPRKGICASCHSGSMLNETNGQVPVPVAPFPKLVNGLPDPTAPCDQPAASVARLPKGVRFQSVLVAELNQANNPVFNFILHMPDGTAVPLPPIADPGRALITGNFAPFPDPNGELFNFKIPSVWGVKKTAPYFHDNSAKSLVDVVNHYANFFAFATGCAIDGDGPLVMTAQDKADLVAFLKLL